MPSRLPSLKVVLMVLVPCMLVLGIWLGAHPRFLPGPIADALVGPEDRRATIEALDTIYDKYYRSIDRGTLSDAAIGGAVDKLDDRFSAYFSPEEYGEFQAAINNEFSGVGTAVRGVEDGLRIQTVYPDSPAKKAGLRIGDIVIAADGRKLGGLSDEKAIALVKGPEGTPVTLTIRRDGKTFRKRLTRATISVPVVDSRLVRTGDERVAHIALSTFGPHTAHVEMNDAIRRAKKRGAKGIVFDLRGNGGGLVTEAQLIASMFIAKGPIVTTKGRAVAERTLKAVGQPVAGKLPTVVLVDEGTASASEIVAGAMQDTKRAKLVGRPTFGKGVFQEILPLDNGGALDITVGQYYLPSGRNLGGAGTSRGSGLKPDIRARDDPDTERDEALGKALDVLAREL